MEADIATGGTAVRAAAFAPGSPGDQVRFLVGTKERSLLIYERGPRGGV